MAGSSSEHGADNQQRRASGITYWGSALDLRARCQ
eukprot:CAMPEP_0115319932 /NCGR_PEP_ID=MMETSP0270-20121206/80048_1 /TAXON_ID=71861 /ORGANISM="Scrippsiella trochoidea, Strain CCMP3099" /LENGTH=34 /DNA_ID= /DNA_START= /DNA_END= /DNA_ORIENTATION=